jgi:hypothetical protein
MTSVVGIRRIFEACCKDFEKVKKVTRFRVVPAYLGSYKENRQDNRPFEILNSHSNCFRTWSRLICYCLRAFREPEHYRVQFSPIQLKT